jgi:hypothetical protein
MKGMIAGMTAMAVLAGLVACNDDEPTMSAQVVINELMASNSSTAADQDGEYDDWIELFNNTGSAYDLTGHFLTDTNSDLTRWQFPNGTSISGNGFLIVWADGDTLQTGLHANFRLSADGEEVLLVNPSGKVIDEVIFGPQSTDRSYARVPNGTGPFSIQRPTFNASNSAP